MFRRGFFENCFWWVKYMLFAKIGWEVCIKIGGQLLLCKTLFHCFTSCTHPRTTQKIIDSIIIIDIIVRIIETFFTIGKAVTVGLKMIKRKRVYALSILEWHGWMFYVILPSALNNPTDYIHITYLKISLNANRQHVIIFSSRSLCFHYEINFFVSIIIIMMNIKSILPENYD